MITSSRFVARVGALSALMLFAATPVWAGPVDRVELPPVTTPTPPGAGGPGFAVEPPRTGAGASAAAAAASNTTLTGTFKVTAGRCTGAVAGSYFRMIQPGGTATGPYVQNSDSPCADKSYSPLDPGADGGLVSGTYQAQPNPAFAASGGGLANRITAPERFFGVDFATATNATDPQTNAKVAAPTIIHDGDGRLTGDVRAFAAAWNNQHFNQGAPKPDGTKPGATAGPTGSYNASTGAYSLDWTSQIVGGPFNNFTGQWHLDGTFVAAASASPSTSAGSSGSSSASPSAGATSGNAAVAGTSNRRTSTNPLASTGPALPAWWGGAALALGLAGLAVSRRSARPVVS